MWPHGRHGRRLAAAALAAALVAGCQRVDVAPGGYAHTNVVLVVVDTQRADRFGGPFLDALAARSFVFHSAYAAASWTRPSVASLFTSRLPSQNGVRGLMAPLPPEETTLAEVLQAHGWLTRGFTANPMIRTRGIDQGFDDWTVMPRVGNQDRSEFRKKPAGGALLRLHAVDWALDLPDDHLREGSFLYLQYMEPHFPGIVDADLIRQVARTRGHPFDDYALFDGWWYYDPANIDALNDFYDASVLTFDRRLAALFEDLGRIGFLDHAIVIVTADHGEELYERGVYGHGHSLFEELVHVPLLVSLPGQDRRVDVDEAVSLLDVGPTVLDLVGVDVPAAFEGRPLRPAMTAAQEPRTRLERLLGRRPPNTRPAFAELAKAEIEVAPTRPLHAIIDVPRKLIEKDDGSYDVFDLARDPKEVAPHRAAPAELAAEHAAVTWITQRAAAAAAVETPTVSPEEMEQLRSLGYVD